MMQVKHATLIAAVMLSVSAAPSLAQQPVEQQIIDAMDKAFQGPYPGFRANHAKGVVAEGHFKASPDAAKLSKAIIFNGSSIPVTVRFSDSTGVPKIPDGSPNASPHGISIKYHLPDGGETNMVLNSLSFFPVSTPAEFRDLLLATAESPDGSPHPTKLELFIKSHPTVGAAIALLGTPDSFADEQYNGVDAFVFVDKDGKKQAVRYILAPPKVVHLSDEAAAKEPPNFLMDEVPTHLAKSPMVFELKAQLAAPGDPTKDPAQPWPMDRKVVDLGTLTIDKAVPNSAEAEKQLVFLPGQLIDGIEKSDDPLIDARDAAYAISYSRRNQ